MADYGDPALLIVGLLLWIVVDWFLYKAAFSDPGLIPRQATDDHIEIHKQRLSSHLMYSGLCGQKNLLTKLKFCYTCLIYRPKRAVHCSSCDVCVEQMDHHCPFISNCVGHRNYPFFFGFIFSLLIDAIFIFSLSIHDIVRRVNQLMNPEETENPAATASEATNLALRQVPLAIPIIILTFVTFVGLAALNTYHIKLCLYNQTTYE